jgi:TolB-like protein/Tfp pilus assembly protein PilF
MGISDQFGSPAESTVFVSYSREDQKQILPIIQLLQAAGYHVWWDGLLEGGERFSDTTHQALENAKAVVVLWSKTSIASHWVHDEATRGRDRQCLVPLSLDGSEPPLGFRQFQFIDISKAKIRADAPEMEKMLRAVANLHGEAAPKPRVATPRPFQLGRREAVGAGVLLAVAGGGFATWKWLEPDASLRSIAVLPFNNLSGDESRTYFSDGLSEELRTTLSLNRQLSVAAQTSSNKFRHDEFDAKAIARQLGVAYILDGSVRQSGDMVRVSAQLIESKTGFEKWSQSFDRKLSDIFAVQSDIATTVADELASKIWANPADAKARVGGTNSVKAYDAYLRGQALYKLAADEESDRDALTQFETAIAADDRYAAAHAAKSRALTVIANNYSTGGQLGRYYAQSVAAAKKAVEIAPDLAEAHSALGFVLFNGMLQVKAASDPYRQSFELGFGNADILAGYANYAARTGNFGDAREAIARAKRLDPLNPSVFRNAGVIEYCDRQYDAAIALFDSALSLNPKIGGVQSLLGDIRLLQGDAEAAQKHFALEPGKLARQKGEAIVAFKLKDAAAGQAVIASMKADFGDNSLYQQAQVMAQWGRPDEAIAALVKAKAAGDSGLVQLRNDPLFDPLRDKSEFKAILTSMGFE